MSVTSIKKEGWILDAICFDMVVVFLVFMLVRLNAIFYAHVVVIIFLVDQVLQKMVGDLSQRDVELHEIFRMAFLQLQV